MATGAVLFALMNFFARLATTSASWATAGAVRAFIGALVAIAVARARGVSLVVKDRKAILLRSVLGTISMIGTFYALSSKTLSLGDTVTLLNLTPLFLALLAPLFLRERTAGATLLALLVALGGVILIVHPTFVFGGAHVPSTAAGPSAGVTAGVALLAAFTTSFAMMLLRRVGRTETTEAIAVHFSLFAAIALSVISIFDFRVPRLHDCAFMLAAGLCAGVAQIVMTKAYALEAAAKVSGMSYLAVVTSALLGAVVLREIPTAAALGGMALVITGGLIVTLARDGR